MADDRFNRSGSRSSKTFKPKKNIPEGTHQYDLMKHAAATLGSGNLRLAVMLPDGEDQNEWVAVNSKDFCFFFFVLLASCIWHDSHFISSQLLTFSIRSTCCMAPLPSFALKRAALSCLPVQSMSTIGQMAKQLRNPSSARLQSILTTS